MKDRRVLELWVFQGKTSGPYLCLLDTWNGADLVDFLKTRCNPKLTKENYPGTVNRLSIKAKAA